MYNQTHNNNEQIPTTGQDHARASVLGGGIFLVAVGATMAWLTLPTDGFWAAASDVETAALTSTVELGQEAPATILAMDTLAMEDNTFAIAANNNDEADPGTVAIATDAVKVAPMAIALPSPTITLARTTPTLTSASGESISVNVGQSSVIDAPWPVARVSITNTDVADVQVLTPEQVLLIGNELGTTDMILWSENEDVWHTRVTVVIDLAYVREELKKIFSDCGLTVDQSQNMLVVGGVLRRAEQAVQLHAALDGYGVKYLDQTSVAGVQQVKISVRVAEVSREAIRSLGANAVVGGNDAFGGLTIGPDGGSALNPISIGAPAGSGVSDIPFSFIDDLGVASGITMFGGIPGADLELFLQALAENQYMRVLAEPTLVALSGSEASFLAGGEFPIPVVQGSGAGGGATVTIEYKEFGIRLNFLPTVLGDNRIRLSVAPEVSDISDIGAVQIEGFRIPSIITRRADTTLEMQSGQTFAMAGLLNKTVNARKSSVPILGDLPILGPMFRSTRYVTGETELVIMVTADLVEPTYIEPGFPVPGDLHDRPSDKEFYGNGRLEQPVGELPAVDQAWMRRRGLDRLYTP